MITENNATTMLKILGFEPAFTAPTRPGQYLVIDEQLRYLSCEAVFNSAGTFVCFQVIGQPESRYKGTEVLVYSMLPPSSQTVQQLYSECSRPLATTQQNPSQLLHSWMTVALFGESNKTEPAALRKFADKIRPDKSVSAGKIIPMFPERAR